MHTQNQTSLANLHMLRADAPPVLPSACVCLQGCIGVCEGGFILEDYVERRPQRHVLAALASPGAVSPEEMKSAHVCPPSAE